MKKLPKELLELDLKNICLNVIETAQKAGIYIKQQSAVRHSVETKSKNSFVTKVDKTSEKNIVLDLQKILPEAGFITEEETLKNKKKKFTWIIDPLDGTTNFLHGVPVYCVSIALMYKNKPIIGVIYEINQQEMFYAWSGGGAYLNGKSIQVSDTKRLQDSLLATGFPYYSFKKMPEYMTVFTQFMRKTRGLRRPGSACADLAYVACGRFDGFFEYGLSPWDVAAGVLLVQEAGGASINFKGGKECVFSKSIISGNKKVAQKMYKLIQQYF